MGAAGFIADDIHSEEYGDWYPIILITMYNVGDVIGKSAPFLWRPPPALVLVLSATRMVFIVLFFTAASWHANAIVRTSDECRCYNDLSTAPCTTFLLI